MFYDLDDSRLFSLLKKVMYTFIRSVLFLQVFTMFTADIMVKYMGYVFVTGSFVKCMIGVYSYVVSYRTGVCRYYENVVR